MLMNTRLLGRIMDDFWGQFILAFNIGFCSIAHLGRYHLGEIDNTWEVNIMVGRMEAPNGQAVILSTNYWTTFYAISCGFSLVSGVVMVTNKVSIYYKEKKGH